MPEVLRAVGDAVDRRRVPRRHRLAVRGAGLGVVLALASGTALAAVGEWNPFGHRDRQAYSLAAPPADQTASLAVLRRDQDTRDRGPLMSAFLPRYRGTQGRVLLRYVRYLRDIETTTMMGGDDRFVRQTRPGILVLMPQEEFGVDLRGPARAMVGGSLCMVLMVDSWPEGAEPPLMMAPPPSSAGGSTTAGPTRPPRLADRVTGSMTCRTPHDLRTDGVVSGAYNYGELTGLVPDGVASVRATTRDGQVVESEVVNNSFQLLAPGRNDLPDPATKPARLDLPALSGQFRHQTLEWLDAGGRVLRVMAQ